MSREPVNLKPPARPAIAGRARIVRRAELQPVRLEFCQEEAHKVSIAGSFNNWDAPATQMVRVEPSRWLRVLFLPPGRYEYLFVVDGHYLTDPTATESAPNVYGCMNSILTVKPARPRECMTQTNCCGHAHSRRDRINSGLGQRCRFPGSRRTMGTCRRSTTTRL